ncbi:hypothetical protein WOLCODRAFT_161206 [Wolfiporia cocos MD-104 SS10]|uniref:Chromo domain-containing protein n=1 Tax=Wolfiporia cocos (strain MD-104) TaxID=742152 RepID=A0A2H3JPP5_WOLCO|nr:hypothetical protein WOLCODRAFT_161206 [Wolfiporia cocos MD-104 SS10]
MSKEVEEYEVESIHRAKLVSKRGKKNWSYYVKWKGYDLDDNTWEPPDSFAYGSEHFIDQFWDRIDIGDRDWRDLSLFKAGDEFFPRGPPRRKRKISQKPKITTSSPAPKSADELERDAEPISDEEDVPAKKRARSSNASADAKVSGSKRKRTRESQALPNAEKSHDVPERKTTRSRSDAEHVSTSRSSKGKMASSPPKRKAAPANHTSAREFRKHRKVIESDSYEDEDEISVVAARAQSRKVQQTDEEELDKEALQSSPEDSLYEAHKSVTQEASARTLVEEDDLVTFGEPILLTTGPPKDTAPQVVSRTSPAVPAHRARAPKVKRFEEPTTNGDDSSSGITLSTKARLIKRAVASDGAASNTAGPSAGTTRAAGNSRTRAAEQRPGPGRSSSGLTMGSRSLLTFSKGKMHTVKRRTHKDKNELSLGESPTLEVRSKLSDAGSNTSIPEPALLPSPLTTANANLSHIGGSSATDADALPDYEDDEDAIGEPDPDVPQFGSSPGINGSITGEVSVAVQTERIVDSQLTTVVGAAHQEGSSIQNTTAELSLQIDEPSIVAQPAFGVNDQKPSEAQNSSPAPAKPAPVNNAHVAAWRLSSIFGPLGVGSSIPRAPAQDATASSSSERARPVISLRLDAAVSVPTLMKDVHPPSSWLNVTDGRLMAEPAGKFYKGDYALALLDTVCPEDFYARLVLDPTADETQKAHFARFTSRLHQGELFVVMVSSQTLAICSSENQPLEEKLRVPSDLVGLEDSIIVARVAIENYSAYADTVQNADDTRWTT